MTSGQDQDNTGSTPSIEEVLARDLRDIIGAGIKLNGTHCSKLLGINSLSFVVSDIRSRTQAVRGHSYPEYLWPVAVRQLIKEAIRRLETSGAEADAEFRKHQAKVLSILFAYTGTKSSGSAEDRRKEALSYYTRHANVRNRAATDDNFARRIIPEELFPLLINELLEWDSEPREALSSEDNGLVQARRRISDAISETLWWPMRVFEMLHLTCHRIREYSDYAVQGNREEALTAAHLSLKYVGGLLRLSREKDLVALEEDNEYLFDTMLTALVHQFFRDFLHAFSFSEQELTWIESAIADDRDFRSLNQSTTSVDRLVIARYTALFQICSCDAAVNNLHERMNSLEYRHARQPLDIQDILTSEPSEDTRMAEEFRDRLLQYLAETDEWPLQPSPLSELCPLHMLLFWNKIFHVALKDYWWNEFKATAWQHTYRTFTKRRGDHPISKLSDLDDTPVNTISSPIWSFLGPR